MAQSRAECPSASYNREAVRRLLAQKRCGTMRCRYRLDGDRLSPDMQVQFNDGLHPPTVVTPSFGPISSVHKAMVTVPNSLPPGTYQLHVVQGDVTGLQDNPVSFTVTP
jgi:hypothetical protein